MSRWVRIALVVAAPVRFTAAALRSPYFGLFERSVQLIFLGSFAARGCTPSVGSGSR
jgi:hypothetical protein